MRELGYRPNTAARALVTGRSRIVGVICHRTSLYGPSAALLGIEQSARDAGYSVLIVGIDRLDAAMLQEAVHGLHRQGAAGVAIIAPQLALSDAMRDAPHQLPAVALWGRADSGVPNIASDEVAGAAVATRHLLGLGHATVWHLAGPPGRYGAGERERGWRMALAEAGVAPPPPLIGDWSARSGYLAGQELLRRRAATAVFAASDQMAIGLLRALHEGGRHVPRDISVIGFDDLPESAFLIPPLTTMRQDFTSLGAAAVRTLLAIIEQDDPLRDTVLPAELVVRASTGPPRRRT